MKTLVSLMIIAGIAFSCETVKVAKFASVENVIDLKLNSSIAEVTSALGSKPYNIYSNHREGYVVYTYKYKVTERKISPKLVDSRGGESNGTEEYNSKEQFLYLFFKEGKLESFVTTEGRKDVNDLIITNNTIQAVSADKTKFISVP